MRYPRIIHPTPVDPPPGAGTYLLSVTDISAEGDYKGVAIHFWEWEPGRTNEVAYCRHNHTYLYSFSLPDHEKDLVYLSEMLEERRKVVAFERRQEEGREVAEVIGG